MTLPLLARSPLCALLLLALTVAAPQLRAQSGRNKQPATRPSAPSTGNTRPKRASTTSGQQGQPAPSQTPSVRLPSGTVVLDEAPPPAPVPAPKPAATETPSADTSPGEEIGAEDVVRITSNLVTVPASVVDLQGKAVADLKLEDFELRVDGQPRPITEMSRAEVPVTLALLFDNSQSLSAAREFEKQAAIKFFRTVIRPIDRAAIYSVDTEVTLAQPLTNSVPSLVHTIERFGKPEGATRLLDAIAEAATYLRPYPGRKVIIIVSDGEDTLSDMDFDTTLRRVLTADCQVYAVQTKQIEYAMLTGERGNANIRSLAAERRLQDLTTHTGGVVYTPIETSDLSAAFAQISADLAQQYILSYYPTDERNDGRFRTISVRVATRPSMRVRARRGYYPRRSNEKFSYNTQVPAVNEFGAGQPGTASHQTATQTDMARTDSLPPAASKAAATGGSGGALPQRSRRVGPSETGDEPEAGSSNIRTVVAVGEPIVKGDALTTKASEPSQPPPKPSPTPAPVQTPPKTIAAQPKAADADSSPRPSESSRPSNAPSQASKKNTDPPATKEPVSGGVLNGRAISLPRPQYPPGAKNIRAEGVVTVEVLVDEQGRVVSARAIDGNQFLRQAAVTAARQARFSPTVLSGQPVKITGVITYKFTLSQ